MTIDTIPNSTVLTVLTPGSQVAVRRAPESPRWSAPATAVKKI
jgi:hypothetical protein